MMKRAFSAVLLATTATLIACEDSPTEPELGGLAFQIYMVGATSSSAPAATSGPSLSSHTTPLDSGRIVLTGPENRTVSATPGTSVTIEDLPLGTYAAVLQGFVGDEITFQGRVDDISVAEGQTSSVVEALFVPTNLEFGAINETIQLSDFPDGTSWDSSDPGIVSVNAAGLLTALTNGTVDITGSVGTTTAQSAAEVHQNVVSVTVDPPSQSIAAGATQQYTATALDDGGTAVTGASVLWISSDPAVAIIDQTGLATGRGGGTTSITAAIDGGVGSTDLTVTGSGGEPARVVFATEPTDQDGYDPIPTITVEIRDANNQLVTTATNDVEIRLRDDPVSSFSERATLDGTTVVAAVGGVATFDDLRIDVLADGFSLEASIGLPATVGGPAQVPGSQVTAISESFDVRMTAQQVATGGIISSTDFTCALSTSGHAFCWGYNGQFQLARPVTFSSELYVPGVVKGVPPFVQITAGGNHACGLTSVADGGDVFCWGANSDGQLGAGTAIGTVSQETPVEVLGSNVFSQISAGYRHTCGITGGGQTFCWGQASVGQVGAGGAVTADQFAPVSVTGGQTMTSITAGYQHTCAINLSQRVFCWGAASQGRLGNNTTTPNVFDPTQVTGTSISFESVSAGYLHTCGHSSSEIYCWGDFNSGQLGPDPTADVLQPSDNQINRGTFGTFDAIEASGLLTTCGLTGGQTVCWGYNVEGQTGVGNDTSPISALTAQPGSQVLTQIDLGYYHGCGVTAVGEVYCWGGNFYGQLGQGDDLPAEIHEPTLVPGTGPSS